MEYKFVISALVDTYKHTSKEQVLKVVEMYTEGIETSEIASVTELKIGRVRAILKGKHWSEITGILLHPPQNK